MTKAFKLQWRLLSDGKCCLALAGQWCRKGTNHNFMTENIIFSYIFRHRERKSMKK